MWFPSYVCFKFTTLLYMCVVHGVASSFLLLSSVENVPVQHIMGVLRHHRPLDITAEKLLFIFRRHLIETL